MISRSRKRGIAVGSPLITSSLCEARQGEGWRWGGRVVGGVRAHRRGRGDARAAATLATAVAAIRARRLDLPTLPTPSCMLCTATFPHAPPRMYDRQTGQAGLWRSRMRGALSRWTRSCLPLTHLVLRARSGCGARLKQQTCGRRRARADRVANGPRIADAGRRIDEMRVGGV